MSELKPCPFHMQPIDPVLYTGYDEGNGSPESGGWWATLECPKCDSVSMSDVECPDEAQAIESVRAKWNTRAERTCENTSMKSDQWLCSECGGNYDIANIDLDPDEDSGIPNYCPNCGAKVVRS